MLQDTVNTIVTDMLKWPHRIVLQIGGIPVDIRLRYLSLWNDIIWFLSLLPEELFSVSQLICSELELKPQGKLTVTVVKANNLKNMEMIGKSDPYVVAHVRPLFKLKTKTVENNLNPVWNEELDFIVEDKETQSIIFEVLNHLSSFSVI